MNSRNWKLMMVAVLCAASAKAAPNILVQEPWDRIEQRRERELRSEVYGPTMTRAEYRKVRAALGARKAREDEELSKYAQFKMAQRSSQVSAPRILVIVYGGPPPGFAPDATWGNQAMLARMIASPDVDTGRASEWSADERAFIRMPAESVSRDAYPMRFYRRLAQEESFDRMNAQLDAQAQADAASVPFGVPVPGLPGYVTSPRQSPSLGYIDARGFSPGAVVVDPFTSKRIRVP